MHKLEAALENIKFTGIFKYKRTTLYRRENQP